MNGSPRTFRQRRASILYEVEAERERQDFKWGGVPGVERRDDHTYAAVLGEEFGECCKAWLEREPGALRAELIQVAAVAIAWIEELDNGGSRARSMWDPGPCGAPDAQRACDTEAPGKPCWCRRG